MTLDEAIKYHLDIADGQDKCADISVSEHAKERISECANNNRQIAEWLTELKEARAELDRLYPILENARILSNAVFEFKEKFFDKYLNE